MTNFRSHAKFKQEALRVLVNMMNEEEINNVKRMFREIDKNNTGYISPEELMNVMKNLGYKNTQSEIYKLTETI